MGTAPAVDCSARAVKHCGVRAEEEDRANLARDLRRRPAGVRYADRVRGSAWTRGRQERNDQKRNGG
jgi:hypothetical protein